MARHVDVWMDGVRLADIGGILLQQVTESPPEMEVTYGARPIRSGRDILTDKRQALQVSITLVIRELFDLIKRNAILQALAQWASGSVLELSNHPGQVLHVRCKSFPSLGEVRNYAAEIKIDLEAAEIPFWVEKIPVSITKAAPQTGSLSLFVPGTALTPVNVSCVTNGNLSDFSLAVSSSGTSKTITLAGMTGLSAGSVVDLKNDTNDRFVIVNGADSLLRYRSMLSADDLMVSPGNVTLNWSMNVSGTMTVTAAGRWL